jgi:integrase
VSGTAVAAGPCNDAGAGSRQDRWEEARAKFPAREDGADGAGARLRREEILARVSRIPATTAAQCERRKRGAGLLLDWLQDQPGDSWQQQWLASGADAAGKNWRDLPAQWMREDGTFVAYRHFQLTAALAPLIAADVVRPSLGWFLSRAASSSPLSVLMTQVRDPDGFTRVRAACERDPKVSEIEAGLVVHRAAVIAAVKGGTLADVTVGDVLELLDAEKAATGRRITGGAVFYRILRQAGVFGDQVPATLRELRTAGQRTPAELIGRYNIVCRPIRDLLVDYLRERQPALDYNSLESLSIMLGKLFWADLEQHHPGISSLHLPAEVAADWKQRLQTVTKTTRTPAGETITTEVPRINYRECLTPVRAFYLDLACWAIEEPTRWGPWAAPCPVGSEEINRTKQKRQRKSRMDARTRERLPVLPVLVRTAAQRRKDAIARLETAKATPAGQSFAAAGQTLTRSVTTRATGRVWADEPGTGRRRDLTREEDRAFWTWATVEVLRATGIRIEELLELTHHSLIQYRLPTTGELVPLLQIAPSKTDAERLLLVSPELADVLSAIISRVRGPAGKIPLVAGYDRHERRWREPAPFLFQHDVHGENRVHTDQGIRDLLEAALAGTGLTDPSTGGPLQYTPHDFRRIFITDAILGGLPPHIAQVIAGHRDINVTMGYKAVYPEEAIQAHLAFLARRRALRPSEEYRTPADEEWEQFLGHFERRKVSTGTCGRAFGTPCIHEHACIRCPMLWPDPAQHERLTEIRDNLIARIAEAEREGWLGEVEGLKVSLAGAEDKLAQISQRTRNRPVDLGIPATARARQPG